MVTSPTSSDSWFLDTRATHHLTNNATHLSDVHPRHRPDQVSIGNGKKLPIHHIGSTILFTKYKKFKLNKVLHAPKLPNVSLVFLNYVMIIIHLLEFILGIS